MRRVAAAEGVIRAAWKRSNAEPWHFIGVAAQALEDAGRLTSPETAADLERLRLLQNAQPAALSQEQIDALADAGNEALNDHYHEDLCFCLAWPESCLSSGNYFAGYWDTAAFSIGMPAVIGAWEAMRARDEADELARLRTRVGELEAALADLTEPDVDGAGRTYSEYQPSAASSRRDGSVAKLKALLAVQRGERP
ncbi:hypothetical protein GCM10010289_38170 [Streptomyces violascens]|uniref:Uncharacterized protein n=1 Tax=Streptomyces violascens TaxID=67381 RepID=A0ABQ3QX85_9ACTN|nr:hypothetical protein GCM10010289_38170 [Streptomyces violascens]GHI41867.1 hypothetical protein Sviol_62750 [Streptomyces violascens]